MTTDPITLTKQDVARRELNTAIELLFRGDDVVAIHLLASAASEIMRAVAVKRGVSSTTVELEDRIIPQRLKEWRAILKAEYNFFKHADRDSDEVVTFNVESTTWTIFLACCDYSRVYKTTTWEMFVYKIWFLCRHPNIALPPISDHLPTMARHLAFPEGKTLSVAVSKAREMLLDGRADSASVVSALGKNWFGALEPF